MRKKQASRATWHLTAKQANQELRRAHNRCQTQLRGTNDQEYQIYVAAAESLGWVVKSYDEWLAS